MDGIPGRPANRSKADLRRLIGRAQARTRRLIAESRELIAQARRIRGESHRDGSGRQDAA